MPVGAKNRYTCEACGKFIVTIDRDEGVTPFMLKCRATKGCAGTMYSSFYAMRDAGEPSFEWRKPTQGEYKAMNAAMQDHVDQGGLNLYGI